MLINQAFYNDLKINTVTELTSVCYKRFHIKFNSNADPLIQAMYSNTIPDN